MNQKSDDSVDEQIPMGSREFSYLMPGWSAPANVRALTTTRNGGYSQLGTGGLNLGINTSDSIDLVNRNRNYLCRALSLDTEPVWLKQVHGTEIISLPTQIKSPIADGATTTKAKQICVILTADCLPLFLSDRFGEQIAVLHVGWRGLAKGIVEKGIRLFDAAPADLISWAGPAISQTNFEIGAEVRDRLGGSEKNYCASERQGHWYVDLYSMVGERLNEIGVSNYGWDPHCTYGDARNFYSYRRESDCGRMASLIWKTE